MNVIITTDRARMDLGAIHVYLSGHSYWAQNIPLPLVARAIEHSLPFAALDCDAPNGDALIGFARVITDYATFGYIADVFVLPSHQGRGIGKQLMTAIREHPELQTLRRWHLVTRDAHALYAQHGFTLLAAPERHMELTKKDAYR